MNQENLENTTGINGKNKYWVHLLKYQTVYLSLLIVIILGSFFALRVIHQQPLFIGGESYYHLYSSQQISWTNGYYLPLYLITLLLPLKWLFILPLIAALGSLLLFLNLTKRVHLSPKLSFLFSFFLIITPAFIYTYTTLSTSSFFILLTLLGFKMLLSKKRKVQYYSLIPFLLITFLDLFSGILLLILLFSYFTFRKKEQIGQQKFSFFTLIVITLMIIINGIVLKIPFSPGPFNYYQYMTDLISDLGGTSGFSFFLLIMALGGIIIMGKQKKYFRFYFLTLLFIFIYIYDAEKIIFLSIIASFLAAQAFLTLFEKKWILGDIQKFTVVLLLLGLLFSTVTYLDRSLEYSPTLMDQEALSWISNNSPSKAKVLALPENGYYIYYFSHREPIYFLDKKTKPQEIPYLFKINYIQELFPLLEKNNINIVYINPSLRIKLASQESFLSLLKNERFKMVYSYEESEVWKFT